MTFAAKKSFLTPRDVWEFPDEANWEVEWRPSVDKLIEETDPKENRPIGRVMAWVPYVLVAVLLVLTRIPEVGIQSILKGLNFKTEQVFQSNISISIVPLYLPGSIFIIVSLVTFVIHRIDVLHYRRAWSRSFETTLSASVALIFTVPLVQVFINSGNGQAGYDAMPIALAEGVSSVAGNAWPLFAPVVGGFGAFIAGSNTVSNMMFSLFQFSVGEKIGVDPAWVVALQAVGGAAGNTICVHNVVAALAVVGLVGREGMVIRKTFCTLLLLRPGRRFDRPFYRQFCQIASALEYCYSTVFSNSGCFGNTAWA